MADDEEAVQNSKGQRRHGEEIHGSDCVKVIAKKRQPRWAGSGLRVARFIQRETVRSETSKPSLSSAPWMQGAPQVGFSATMRKISSRTSLLIGFLRPRFELARCKPSTVESRSDASEPRSPG